ncbi:50S ribosomal protein L13 [Planoprotostelium fungivorum]|uniref:50S ribosomal protein L13 n=1 Tax=Planoprotostelium fungivorum TaxID=1890364 RepID=A0A2P6MVX8_9EUKA|nr:50S ribosomal protein L13 [Planoprotostelium fungivorum]
MSHQRLVRATKIAAKPYTLPKYVNYDRTWHQVDATGKVVGRLANEISHILQGKHKPIRQGLGADVGDFVVVINADKAIMTGKKWMQKRYVKHSGHPGGRKEIPVAVWKANYPDRIISHAVRGMLPRNNLRDVRMARLKLVLAGQDNEHERLVQQTPQMKHISDAFFRASFREPLFDPAVHAGWYLKTVVDADGVSEIIPTRTEGKGKYKFVTRLREPKLETPFKDRVVKKRKPLPTIFSLLPEKVQKAALKK